MTLEDAECTFRLNRNELSTLCWMLKRALMESIDRHDIKKGETYFYDTEKEKIALLKFFSSFTGYGIYEEFEYDAKRLFQAALTQKENKNER